MRFGLIFLIQSLCWIFLVFVQYWLQADWPTDWSVVWVSLSLAFATIQPLLMAHSSVWFPERWSGFLTCILLQFALACTSASIVNRLDPHDYDGHQRFFLLLTTVGYFGSLTVFLLFRCVLAKGSQATAAERTASSQSQFSILNIIVWTLLAAVLIAFAPNAWQIVRFPSPIKSAAVIAVACLAITVCVYWPLFRFIYHARRPVRASGSLMVVAIPLASVLALYYLKLVKQVFLYDSAETAWFVVIVIWAPLTLAVFSSWVFAIQWNNRRSGSNSTGKTASPSLEKFARFTEMSIWIVACGFVLYSVGWSALHFALPNPKTDVTLLQHSNLMKRKIIEAYARTGSDIGEGIRNGEDVITLKNRLSSASVTADQNAIHQIMRLCKFEFADDNSWGPGYLRALGFSETQIDQLPNKQLSLWLKERRPGLDDGSVSGWNTVGWYWNRKIKDEQLIEDFLQNASNEQIVSLMLSANWNADELPIGAQYCREMQDVFQSIREATQCPFAFSPLVRSGELSDVLIPFVWEMLLVDSHYQVSLENLDRAVENCEALFRFCDLLANEAAIVEGATTILGRMRAEAMQIAERVLTHKLCNRSHVERIRRLIAKEIDFVKVIERSSILSLAYWNWEAAERMKRQEDLSHWMHRYLAGMEDYPFLRLYHAQPQMVDWEEFIQVSSDLLERHVDFLRKTEFGLADGKAFSTYVEKLETTWDAWYEDALIHSTLSFALGPKTKARQLGEHTASEGIALIRFQFMRVVADRIRRAKVAVLIHQNETGRLPDDLSQIVSEDTRNLVVDPFTGEYLIYHKQPSSELGFEVYSSGPNGIDNSGGVDDFTDLEDSSPSTLDYLKSL